MEPIGEWHHELMMSFVEKHFQCLPGLAVDDIQVRTESSDKHVGREQQLSDGGWGQRDRQTHAPQQGRRMLPGQREGNLRPEPNQNLNHLQATMDGMTDQCNTSEG